MEFLDIGFFIVGLLLILIEVFAPGMLFGIAGVMCILIGIFLSEDDLGLALVKMAFVVIIMAVIAPFFIKYIKRSGRLKKITVGDALRTEEGYVSRKSGMDLYVGKSGFALTDLRPSGTVQLEDGTLVDVVTQGSYIPKGAEVVVVKLEGTWLVVKQA